ncbi:thyrotropin-releasing hormone receptor-like [Biomphalaria glabrata]|uniref:Thyrotropin-releasing hormone receptor-like n=1 Tax=Biomphalaria glabrata TaxID=6526 RepID=A0A9W3AKS8_BIOGL|nr:thyrotropin-releasing hormone receptor-like [Biomphalaria glabrata]XP_055887872.1 thyrotropin-releasing hormone receptor-like [Biomphalaria glabrata]
MELPVTKFNFSYNQTGVYTGVHFDGNKSSRQEVNGNVSLDFDPLGPPDYMYAYVTLLTSIVFLVGVIGNTLVIQVVIRIRSMRRRMNYFLVCLSVADLLVLLVALPSGLQEFYGKEKWFIGGTLCKLVVFSENVAHHSSVLTLLAIGFERYFAICHPLKETIGAKLSSEKILIPVVWTLSCIATLPFAIFYDTVVSEYVDGTLAERCTFNALGQHFGNAYILFIFTVFFAIPIVLLTILYSAISVTIATSTIPTSDAKVCSRGLILSCRQPRLHGNASTNKAMSSRRQVVRVMIAIMCMYFICLLPLRCFQIWTLFAKNDDWVSLGHEGYLNLINTSRILVYVNSAGDPIIYGMLCSNFRAAFKKSFNNCRSKSSHDGLRSNTQCNYNSQPSLGNHIQTRVTLKRKGNGELSKCKGGNQTLSEKKPNETHNGNARKRSSSPEEEINTELVTFDCAKNGIRLSYV